MKKITKQLLFISLSILSLSFIGCSKDDATGKSNLQVVKGVTGSVSLNAGLLVSQTINEPKNFSDSKLNETLKYSYVVTIDIPQSVDIHVRVVQASGNATVDEDFSFDNDLVIPAYETSVTGTITILSDETVEGDETLVLQIGTVSTSNATLVSSTVTFNIKNYLSPDLEFTFDYNQILNLYGVPSSSTLYNFSGNANPFDMDYIVLDSQFNDTGLYGAATASEPEKLVVSDAMLLPDGATPNPNYLPDGIYYINFLIYRNFFTANPLPDVLKGYGINKVPTTVTYLRRGGITSGTFVQEDEFVPSTFYSFQDESNFVVAFKKLNGIYSILDSKYIEGDPLSSLPIASGRMSSSNEKIKMAIANARRNHKN